ncbi:MAG: phosphatidylglycerol lysyltransferase domain-containing protein [Candidatus Omnitrophota bacterium]
MKLKKLCLKDRPVFDKFLYLTPHSLSVYAFENIYIWRGLYEISWGICEGSLCIFFRDKTGCFLYLPPLAKTINPKAIRAAFEVMDSQNKNCDISRVENLEEKDIALYERLGYACRFKSVDYICLRKELAALRGNKFKHKRACCNYFTKNYFFDYMPFSPRHKAGCLNLYNRWMRQRSRGNRDKIYRMMLLDSRICLKELFGGLRGLEINGAIVKMGKGIKAFTLGFRLRPDTFCILYEIADLSIKGLSQFIFRRFSEELAQYRYINIMDDSGLENLRNTKLSYRPCKTAKAFIAARK